MKAIVAMVLPDPGAPRMSHARAARLGWTRVDPKPWGKLDARWRHESGWTLEHCGHPTALWPWDLHDPKGRRHLAAPRRAWTTLEQAMGYVAGLAS